VRVHSHRHHVLWGGEGRANAQTPRNAISHHISFYLVFLVFCFTRIMNDGSSDVFSHLFSWMSHVAGAVLFLFFSCVVVFRRGW